MFQAPSESSDLHWTANPTFYILFFIACAIAVVLVYRWSMKQRDKISCPHCGANWWSWQSRGGGFGGSGGEYFCYNCQRYWA